MAAAGNSWAGFFQGNLDDSLALTGGNPGNARSEQVVPKGEAKIGRLGRGGGFILGEMDARVHRVRAHDQAAGAPAGALAHEKKLTPARLVNFLDSFSHQPGVQFPCNRLNYKDIHDLSGGNARVAFRNIRPRGTIRSRHSIPG